jgi:carbon-monoxide dehydrogenase medium subunit
MVELDPTITHLVDVSRLPNNYILRRGGSVLIGAGTKIRQIELSPVFRKPPLNILHDAASDFGTVQVRNMASVGGNLCNGIPSADMPPPLIALDAKINIANQSGGRNIPLQNLYRHARKISLRRGELLNRIIIPRQPPRTAGAYVRLTRTQMDIALVSAAVRITIAKVRRVMDFRLILGAVAPTPLRCRKAEDYFRTKMIDRDTVAQMAQLASSETKPISDVRATAEYRSAMAAVLAEKAVHVAASRLGVKI